MENIFKKISVNDLPDNLFKLLNDDWGLLSAGKNDNYNAMTISWGTFGILWNKPVLICFVRPQRHTYEFMNKNHYFTLSFFTEDYRHALEFCGRNSGRYVDKIREAGLVPSQTDLGNIIFEQARVAFECKKIYSDDIKPEAFTDLNIPKTTYLKNDFHRMYIGEIVNCFMAY